MLERGADARAFGSVFFSLYCAGVSKADAGWLCLARLPSFPPEPSDERLWLWFWVKIPFFFGGRFNDFEVSAGEEDEDATVPAAVVDFSVCTEDEAVRKGGPEEAEGAIYALRMQDVGDAVGTAVLSDISVVVAGVDGGAVKMDGVVVVTERSQYSHLLLVFACMSMQYLSKRGILPALKVAALFRKTLLSSSMRAASVDAHTLPRDLKCFLRKSSSVVLTGCVTMLR